MTRLSIIGQFAQMVAVGLLPIASLFGNAPADLALMLLIIIYLVTDKLALKDISHSSFLKLSAIFWIWIVVCSAVSIFPTHSFQDSLPWIRFPVYAFILSKLLCQEDKRFTYVFFISSILSTLTNLIFMFKEHFEGRESQHLYGLNVKQIAGVYVLTFGLICLIYILEHFMRERDWNFKKITLTVSFLILVSFGMIITHEFFNNILFFSIIILYIASLTIQKNANIKTVIVLFGAFIMVISTIALLYLYNNDFHAMLNRKFERLPWVTDSEYSQLWKASIKIGLDNPIFGVGPKNSFKYCGLIETAGLLKEQLGLDECIWHSHNLYMQTIAETGFLGLALFSLIVFYLIKMATKHNKYNDEYNLIPLIFFLIMLFPLQTYSQAFGQSRNFYLWTALGFALAMLRKNVVAKANIKNKL